MQVSAETFLCVVCEATLPADKLAFDTDPEHRMGVCMSCDEALQEADALSAWMTREVA